MGAANKLQRAILLIQSGNKRDGGRLLAEILQADPRNETAWFWMSGIVASDEQRIDCLKRVLEINPENHVAREALIALRGKPTGSPESAPVTRLPAEAAGEQVADFGPAEPLEAIPRPAPSFQTPAGAEEVPHPSAGSTPQEATDLTSDESPQSGPAPASETPTRPLGEEKRRFNVLQALILPLVALSAIIVSTLLCYTAAQEIVDGAMPDIRGQRAFWRFLFSWLLTLLGPIGVIILGLLVALLVGLWALSRIIRPPATTRSAPVDQQAPGVTQLEPVSTPSAKEMAPQERPTASLGVERSEPWSVRTLLIAAILAVLILAAAACASLFLANNHAGPGLAEGGGVASLSQLCQGLAIH
jgi:uncharacterized membrane protein